MSTEIAAKSLTIERIFASPDLSGPTLRSVKISPDGKRVTFLRGKQDDREQLDLWEYHIADGATRLLVDSLQLVPDAGELSAEEAARRERQRLAGLRGIIAYQWSDTGDALLFPLDGDLYHFDLTAGKASQLTATDAFETDPKLSPDGKQVAFVRAQNLHVIDIASGVEKQLTRDGKGTVHNGVAEFIAQEEMDRDSGYWWSPDSSQIAFIRFDESPVDVVKRYEIDAESVAVVEQRYPATGTDNVTLKLGVLKVTDATTQWLDLGDATDFYLPRVKWYPDSIHLSYQWQSRDQQTLELRVADLEKDHQHTLVTESADTFVNLHHDLKFVQAAADDSSVRFIWSSERSGYRHLYLYDKHGKLLRALTSGDWQIDRIEGIDEQAGLVYFTSNKDNVVEQQLYAVSYRQDDPAVTRITEQAGWHAVSMADSGTVYVDTYSSRNQPPQVSLHSADGEQLTWLQENAVDQDHPYAAYAEQHQTTDFGTLTATDGQTLHYRMLKPAGFDPQQQYPVFVYLYGGPHVQVVNDNWDRRVLFEQYMAQQGFVVFSLDNRGSARRGTAFENPIYRSMGTVEVQDQLQGVEFLRGLDYIDADKIGLFGWSYGGYMTLMGLLQGVDEDQSAYALGVSAAPVTDWRLYDTHYTERYMQTPQQNPDGYQAGNVLSYTGNLPADGSLPLLIIHGMADDNVLFTNSTLLFKDLQDKGKLFDIMTYPGAKHGISGSTSQTHVYRTIAEYFQKLK